MIYVCVCFVLVLILIYFHLTRNFNYWKVRNVPYLKPTIIFGNLYSMVTFKKSLTMFLDDIYIRYKSPYFGFFVFDQPFLLVQDPELIKRVLVTDFDYFCDRSVLQNKYDKYSAKTLFVLPNPEWKITRTKASSAFSSGKLKSMVPFIVQAGEELVEKIKKDALNKESVDCRNFSVKFAIDVISSCAFGFKAQAHDNSMFSIASKELQGTTILRGIQQASHFFAPVLVKIFRMKFVQENYGRFLEEVFLNAMKERIEKQVKRGDLLDLLIKLKAEEKSFDQDILVSLAIQFLVAGFETSGATIAFALYELSLNKPRQDRLRNEIFSVLANYDTITYDSVHEMKYLEMVVKETLRKYPSLAFLDRRCTKDYKVPNSDLVIEKGIPIYISIWSLHYDSNYFPEPQKFDPERFSSENKSSINPYTYMPFGEGYRNCLGAKFGTLSVCIGIIHILRNFEVEMSSKTPKTLKFIPNGFLIIPEDYAIHLKFKPLYN